MTCFSRLALVLLVAASAATTQDEQDNRQSLKGLKGVQVVIEHLDAEAGRGGLYETTIQTDVELKLRQAGIRVLTQAESLETPGFPYLYINVGVIELWAGESYVYRIDLRLKQSVVLARDPSLRVVGATTWSAPGHFGIAPRERLATIVRDRIKDQVDRFINAYLSVNPR